MTTGSGARNSTPRNNSNLVTFTSPNGGQFQALKWPRTENYKGNGPKTFTCHGYRLWNELALEYGVPILEKEIVQPFEKLVNAPIRKITVAKAMYNNKETEVTDSSYDSGSFSNGGSSGRTSVAGQSIGIGYEVWLQMRKRLPFTGLHLFYVEVVLVFKGGAAMCRARISTNGGHKGHNSLDLYCRTGEDKLITWEENYVKAGGFFNNPGDVYIAPYDSSVHSGIPYWGEIIGLKDDNDYFLRNLRDVGKEISCGDQGMVFSKNGLNTDCYKTHRGYDTSGDTIKRTNVDCPDYKGIGSYKELLDMTTKEQVEGSGAFFSYTDPEDETPPDYLVDPYKNVLCAKYYAWKTSGKLDLNGLVWVNYDIFEEDGIGSIVAEHRNKLDPGQFGKGGYLYVFVFWSWAGWESKDLQLSLGSDWTKVTAHKVNKATAGKSFHVWKFDATHEKLKNKLYKDFANQDVYGLNS